MRIAEDDAAAPKGSFDVEAFVAQRPLGMPQVLILLVTAVAMLIDGYDIFLIGNIMPAIARDFGVTPGAMVPVLLLQQLALAVGAFVVAPLADRVGRRTVIVTSLVGFGVLTWVGTLATSIDQLALTRLGAGLFLGGVLPNSVALVAEYAPAKRRATFVTLLFVGFSLGTVAGALFGSRLAAEQGWRAAFLVGAVAPIVIAAVCQLALPESLAFRVLRKSTDRRIPAMLRRLDRTLQLRGDEQFHWPDRRTPGVAAAALFRDGRAPTTITLAAVFALALLNVGLTTAWMPTVLVQRVGITLQEAGQFGAIMGMAGIVSMLVYGRLIDWLGARPVLIASYVIGAVAQVGVALVDWHSVSRIVLTALIGATTMAAQSGLNAFTASLYPASIRATGIGWTSGAGRTIALAAPALGGALVASGLSFAAIAALFALPLVLIVPLLLAVRRQAATENSLR